MNPGIGKTTKRKNWEGDCGCATLHQTHQSQKHQE